jgi:hypothetical protein
MIALIHRLLAFGTIGLVRRPQPGIGHIGHHQAGGIERKGGKRGLGRARRHGSKRLAPA